MAQVAAAMIQTCKCHVPQRAKGKKKALVVQINAAQMQKPQDLQGLAGREDRKQDDCEGLILFSSLERRAIMTLTCSWFPALRSRFWPQHKSGGTEPSGVMGEQELEPGAAKQGSGQTSPHRRHGRHGRLCVGSFSSSGSFVPERRSNCSTGYCSHVKSGRAAFIRGEIWLSNAAAHPKVLGSSSVLVRINWLPESFEPQRNLCGPY